MFKILYRQILAWFFIRKIGKTWRAYQNIEGQAEKMSFLVRVFGKQSHDVLLEQKLREIYKS